MGNKKLVTLLDLCVSSLRRGHANLLCIVPILTDDLLGGSTNLGVSDCPKGSPALRPGTSGFPASLVSAWSGVSRSVARLAKDSEHTFSAFWL
jgi:hypothetical protein